MVWALTPPVLRERPEHHQAQLCYRFPVTGTSDGYQYLKLNDYLDGAMKITDSYAGTFYLPKSYIQMGSHPNVSKTNRLAYRIPASSFGLKTPTLYQYGVIPGRPCSGFIVTMTSWIRLTTPVYTISYSGTIQVPQSCEINAGNVVEFDFDIGASLFSKAGIGNKPEDLSAKQNHRHQMHQRRGERHAHDAC